MPSLFEVNKLMHQVMSGQLSRRDFVKRLTALGFTVPAISAFLAACGDEGTSAPPTSGADATAPSSGAIPSPAATGETPAATAPGDADKQGAGKRGGVLRVAREGRRKDELVREAVMHQVTAIGNRTAASLPERNSTSAIGTCRTGTGPLSLTGRQCLAGPVLLWRTCSLVPEHLSFMKAQI